MEDWQLNQSPSSNTQSATGKTGRGRGPSQNRYLRALAEALIAGGEAQRPALAKRLGVSKQAVSELMANLEMRGLVQVRGQLGGLPGRSDLSYTLRPGAALAIGFEIADGALSGAIADLRSAVLAEGAEALAGQEPQHLAGQVARMAERLCREGALQRFLVQACVIAVPNVLPPADRTELLARLGPALGCPISVAPDNGSGPGRAKLIAAVEMARRQLLTALFGPEGATPPGSKGAGPVP